MATFNMHRAKTELSDLVARAEAGEEIVIARRNKPAVRLVPVKSPDKKPRVPGALAHLRDAVKDVDWFEPLPEAELRAWEGRGFSEDGPHHGFDTADLAGKVEGGVEFTLMRDGEPVGVVRPIAPGSPEAMGYGMLRHLKGKIPDSAFFDPLPEEELKLWEGGD